MRINTKSDLGNYSYEVYDTKITKNLRPKHVLQITGYSYLLGKLQNLLPRHMYLIDGNNKFNPYSLNFSSIIISLTIVCLIFTSSINIINLSMPQAQPRPGILGPPKVLTNPSYLPPPIIVF